MNFRDSLYRIIAPQKYQQSITSYFPPNIAIKLSFPLLNLFTTTPNPSSPPLPCIARRGSQTSPLLTTACYAFPHGRSRYHSVILSYIHNESFRSKREGRDGRKETPFASGHTICQ